MKRVFSAVLISGALLVAAPTAAFAHDNGVAHNHHFGHHYSCWDHRWSHDHHFGHHYSCWDRRW